MELDTILARLSENTGIAEPFGASHFPIYQSATFDLKKQQGNKKYDYSRSGNPTRDALSYVFTKAEEGAGTICTNTGVSAVSLLFRTVLKSGDSVLVERDCYGGTYRLLNMLREKYSIHFHFADFTDLKSIKSNLENKSINLVLCESPTNPGLKVLDLTNIAKLCSEFEVPLAVDNSLATFASQKPLELGADFSITSATKYISGHGAAVAGLITAKSEAWAKKLYKYANAEGISQSPFEAFLISLGLPTLICRMKAHEKSAIQIANYLLTRSDILEVKFPFLSNHPQYELAKRQMKICPGVITLNMISQEKAEQFVSKTKLFGEKASFGSADSRIEQPIKISHASYPKHELDLMGIDASTIRLSIGLEHPDDLIQDIESALG